MLIVYNVKLLRLQRLVENHGKTFVVVSSELGKLLYESNILHITSYFYEEVIYYSYILLYQKSNSII